MSTPRQYEDRIGGYLSTLYADCGIPNMEVRVRRSLGYRSEEGYKSYSPIIDVSVGPFSEERGTHLWKEYNQLVDSSHSLIDGMLGQFSENYRDFGKGFFRTSERTLPINHNRFRAFDEEAHQDVNWNARCFMAIEVEDGEDPKHLLGDMFNVSVSGRIGLVIGFNTTSYETSLRLLEYIAYTIEAKKMKFNSRNIIILKPDQFKSLLIKNLRES